MKIRPEFFDIFGVGVFIYIISISILIIKEIEIPKIAAIILLIIGVCGFIVDSSIVTKKYLLKNE